jgi:Uma2 family endonuclease
MVIKPLVTRCEQRQEHSSAMSILVPLITADDLEQFPDDGLRREVIAGELYVSEAPARIHQRLSALLHLRLADAVETTGWGEVYYAPVDVRFTERDQVQPDLLVIRKERLGIYRGHIAHGAPDVIIEILSPSNRTVDLVQKAQLYADHGVPEYWILDPVERTTQLFTLKDKQYLPVEPDGGLFRSTVVPGLVIDPAELYSRMPSQ